LAAKIHIHPRRSRSRPLAAGSIVQASATQLKGLPP
jgi:hypothetical protein